MKLATALLATVILAGCVSRAPLDGSKLEQRRYRSRDSVEYFVRKMGEPRGLCAAEPGESLSGWTKRLLSEVGMSWPDGSSLQIDTNHCIITVINTPRQLGMLEAICTTWDDTGHHEFIRLEEAQHQPSR